MNFTKKQLGELKKILFAKKESIEKQLAELKKSLDFGSDIDSFEEEADEAEEYANYLGVRNVLRKRLLRIEETLAQIEHGVYGKCQRCERKIAFSFLKKNPDSVLCLRCKKESK